MYKRKYADHSPYQANIEEYEGVAGLAISTEIHAQDMGKPIKPLSPAIRKDANKASVLLEGVFDDISQEQHIQRDLVTGSRIDSRKRHQIAVGLLRGDVDSDVIRPYYRRDNQPALPKITIIASCGVYQISEDYMERIAGLGLGLSWACEAIGIESSLHFLEGHDKRKIRSTSPWREATLSYTFIEPGIVTSLQQLGNAARTSLVVGTGFNYLVRDYDVSDIFTRLSSKKGKSGYNFGSGHFPSENGGEGVHWARTVKNAEVVIAIGNFTDKDDADIHLSTDFDLMGAVKEIGIQARKLTLQ